MAPAKKTTKKQVKTKTRAKKQPAPAQAAPAAEVLPYRDNQAYLEDVLSLVGGDVPLEKAKEHVFGILENIEKRVRVSTAEIPFEQVLKKHGVTPLQRYYIYWVIYHLSVFRTVSTRDFFAHTQRRGICSAAEALRLIADVESPVYQVLVRVDDRFTLNVNSLSANMLLWGPVKRKLAKKGAAQEPLVHAEAKQEQQADAQKEEKKTQPETYAGVQEYLTDVINLIRKDIADKKTGTERIAEKCQNSAVPIPFEEELKKANLTVAERFCVYKAAVDALFGKWLNKSEFFNELQDHGFCSAAEAAQLIFNKKSSLYSSKLVVSSSSDRIRCKDELLDKLLTMPEAPKKQAEKTTPGAENKEKILESPVSISQALEPYVVSQQSAKEGLATAVYEHFLRCRLAEKKRMAVDKVNVLLWGPTGTGKTYLCRTLANLLSMPFYIADASQMTDTGYVGLSADSVLTGLAAKITSMNNKFPPSIVYLDEVDKICYKPRVGGSDISGKAVQEELLKLLEADRYATSGGRFGESRQYDISNVLFIAGGAFEGLDKIVKRRVGGSSLGFVQHEKANDKRTSPRTEDFVKYGFMPEFLGRFTKWIQLDALNEEHLITILDKSKDSPVSQYKAVFEEAGIKLVVPQSTLQHIARRALKNGTGARGLKNVLSAMLGKALFKCKKEQLKEYTLEPENT